MEGPVRIAVVGPVDDRLVGDLRSLPLRPTVRRWPLLCGDSEALAQFQPTVLVVAFGPEAAEEIGAVRLLRQLWPDVGVVLVTAAGNELTDAPLAARLGARLLVHPDAPGQLAATIEQALLGGNRPHRDAFLDLARGVADEVNNPLMFVAGQLQLLRSALDPSDRDRRDQITAALDGTKRIQQAVDRLRLVAQAANGPRRHHAVDLAALLSQAIATRGAAGPSATTLEVAAGAHVVPGDPEQLGAAITAIVTFGADLATLGAETHLQLDVLPTGRRLRLLASGASLASWQLPATFEPYYPNRALRGQGYGLGLFLAQTVVLGHRGQATARRMPAGSLQVDFVLPIS